MNEVDHARNLQESIDVLDESITTGIEKRQRTVGFHVSAAAVELLEMYLHKQNLLPTSHLLKHDWFTSLRRANEHIPFPFQRKDEILSHIISIEEKRNLLCYGKQQPKQMINKLIETFNLLKKIFSELKNNES